MADRIALTASDVLAVAKLFQQASEDTQAQVDALRKQVDGMSASWEGDSYNQFSSNFEDIATQMKNIVDLYAGLDTQLQGIVKTLIDTDAQIKSSLSGG